MARRKTKLSGFFDITNKIEDFLLFIFVAGMTTVILIQIIGRIVGHPFPWTEESSRYLFLWMMFVALAAGFNRCESARVTLFVQMAPNWFKKFVEVNPIDNFNYEEEAALVKDNVSEKVKLQDALLVLNIINGPMDLVFLIKEKLKKYSKK